MNKKRTIIITIIVVIFLVTGGVLFWVLNKEDENTTLTLLEKQWIESNKNQIIDLAIMNDIPIFNYNGSGVFFDFLSDLEEDTKLDFNPIPYDYQNEVTTPYALQIKDKKEDNSILFYTDYYVLIGRENQKLNQISQIQNVQIGVLDSDLEKVETYLSKPDITLESFETIEELTEVLDSEEEIDYIALPRIIYLENIVSLDNWNIAYDITDLKQYYVLKLGDNERLNGILQKYISRWTKNTLPTQFNYQLNKNYLSFKDIEESQKAKFRSKTYSYGFIKNAPFDYVIDGKLLGFNSAIIKNFASLAGIELELHSYSSINELLGDFNANNLDFIFNNYKQAEYKMDVVDTVSPYEENMVIVSDLSSTNSISSVQALTDVKVMTLQDSKINDMFDDKKITYQTYESMDELLKKYDKNSVAALDEMAFEYYRNDYFSTSKVDYRFNLDNDYTFTVRSVNENRLFQDYFDFYLSFINTKELQNAAYFQLVEASRQTTSLRGLILFGSLIVVVLILLFILIKILPKKGRNKKKNVMSKADKLKYIDMLTSLKNRNYLNDNIEQWDDTEVYPQTIIIIDLNNIAYINDNYGHAEGDTVIREAANILIKNQIENSEIIRTNGNEFLIYLVGYDEKHVVSYVRKLTKELKELAHGFGAAAGYSMINDAIKTIDDAVNEATLDMRNNKEELNN